MPKLTIRSFATLGELLPSKNMEVSTSATTVQQLIDFIAKEYNPRFKEQIIDPKTGKVHGLYKIFVNGRDIDFVDRLETKLKDGDNVAFFPPVGGG
ncbi:MAG: MoaD family protein [Candidatus Bathyarchaeia archaeon]|nr:MoaD family protein [Candidatus Bathyarchaeia archaeon]